MMRIWWESAENLRGVGRRKRILSKKNLMKSNLILKFLNENIIKLNFMKNNLIKKLKISGYHER